MKKAFGALGFGLVAVFLLMWLGSPVYTSDRYGSAFGRMIGNFANWFAKDANDEKFMAGFGFIALCIIVVWIMSKILSGGGKHE